MLILLLFSLYVLQGLSSFKNFS